MPGERTHKNVRVLLPGRRPGGGAPAPWAQIAGSTGAGIDIEGTVRWSALADAAFRATGTWPYSPAAGWVDAAVATVLMDILSGPGGPEAPWLGARPDDLDAFAPGAALTADGVTRVDSPWGPAVAGSLAAVVSTWRHVGFPGWARSAGQGSRETSAEDGIVIEAPRYADSLVVHGPRELAYALVRSDPEAFVVSEAGIAAVETD